MQYPKKPSGFNDCSASGPCPQDAKSFPQEFVSDLPFQQHMHEADWTVFVEDFVELCADAWRG